MERPQANDFLNMYRLGLLTPTDIILEFIYPSLDIFARMKLALASIRFFNILLILNTNEDKMAVIDILIKFPFFVRFVPSQIRFNCSNIKNLPKCDNLRHTVEFDFTSQIMRRNVVEFKVWNSVLNERVVKLAHMYDININVKLIPEYPLYARLQLIKQERRLNTRKQKKIELTEQSDRIKLMIYTGKSITASDVVDPIDGTYNIKRLIRWYIKSDRYDDLLLTLTNTNSVAVSYAISKICKFNRCFRLLPLLCDFPGVKIDIKSYVWCMVHDNLYAFLNVCVSKCQSFDSIGNMMPTYFHGADNIHKFLISLQHLYERKLIYDADVEEQGTKKKKKKEEETKCKHEKRNTYDWNIVTRLTARTARAR